MKSTPALAVATWMLEHVIHDEAIVGDLLEGLDLGRSPRWFYRQVLSVIGATVLSRSIRIVSPLAFSIVWSLFYPGWSMAAGSHLSQTLFQRSVTLDWPFSASLELATGIVPAATFMWLGFFLYRISSRERFHGISMLRLLASLSISLNVLLISTVGLSIYFGGPSNGLHPIAAEGLPPDPHWLNLRLFALSIPLTVGLFSALACALSGQTQQHPRTRSLAE